MSYMNDIGVVMKKQNWEEFIKKLNNLDIENDENFKFNKDRFLRNVKVINRENNNIILLWVYQKWDPATDEIVEMFIDYLRSLDTPIRYIRIGEAAYELDDIEDHWWNGTDKEMDLIGIRRNYNIEIRGGFLYGK